MAWFILTKGASFTRRSRSTRRPLHFYPDKPVFVASTEDTEFCRTRPNLGECNEKGVLLHDPNIGKGRFPKAKSVTTSISGLERKPQKRVSTPEESERANTEAKVRLAVDVTKLNAREAMAAIGKEDKIEVLLAYKEVEKERGTPRITVLRSIEDRIRGLEECDEDDGEDGEDWDNR